MMREFFRKHPETEPPANLPHIRTDLYKLDDEYPSLVWFGHSSYLLRTEAKNFLVDPVLSGNAAPLKFMVKAFPGSNVYGADDLPFIDHLVLTHDHYDHLDFRTILQLAGKTGSVYCSLGVGAHLIYWGMDPAIITELDWWEQAELPGSMILTAAPARHFSGRGVRRGQSLWSSFVLQTPRHVFYLGGDSGYDSHFSDIGERFGPFDMAILEAGQYNPMWPLVHMMPEEAVQAAADLGARSLLPVHWGKFRLSTHPWNEPVKRIVKKAKETGMNIVTPMIGEPLSVNGHYHINEWWNF